MSPKSLLRAGTAASTLDDLASGHFAPVLADPVDLDTEGVRTVALCSGKMFYDIARAREARADLAVAALRLEELYPFPEKELRRALDVFPNANDIVWTQEEPINMGAWWYVSQKLPPILGRRRLRYAGRDDAASPATGSYGQHQREQEEILATLFEESARRPRLASKRSKRTSATGTNRPANASGKS